jgi:hypothetical protein
MYPAVLLSRTHSIKCKVKQVKRQELVRFAYVTPIPAVWCDSVCKDEVYKEI